MATTQATQQPTPEQSKTWQAAYRPVAAAAISELLATMRPQGKQQDNGAAA